MDDVEGEKKRRTAELHDVVRTTTRGAGKNCERTMMSLDARFKAERKLTSWKSTQNATALSCRKYSMSAKSKVDWRACGCALVSSVYVPAAKEWEGHALAMNACPSSDVQRMGHLLAWSGCGSPLSTAGAHEDEGLAVTRSIYAVLCWMARINANVVENASLRARR